MQLHNFNLRLFQNSKTFWERRFVFEATEKPAPAVNYDFDKLKWAVDAEYKKDGKIHDKLDEFKKAVEEKLKDWFQQDIAELKNVLGEKRDTKADELWRILETKIQIATNTLWTELKDIQSAEGKLNEQTKQAVWKIFEDILKNPQSGAKELMEEANRLDENSEKYRHCEKEEVTLNEAIDGKIKEKMGTMGTILSFLSEKFLGVSVKDLIKDPNSPYGDLLRGIFGVEGIVKDRKDKDVLKQAKNPFEAEFREALAEPWTAKLEWITIEPDNKVGQEIVKVLGWFKKCEGLQIVKCPTAEQTMQLRAQNWDQVVFLRKFLPHSSTPEKLNDFAQKYGDYLPKEKHSLGAQEYSAEQKKYFPSVVAVDSAGFDVTIKWTDYKNISDAINQAGDKLKGGANEENQKT